MSMRRWLAQLLRAAGPCAHVAGTTRLRARLDLAGWTIALACCLVLRVRTITYQNTLDAGEIKHKFENDAALLRALLIGCITDLTQLARQAHR